MMGKVFGLLSAAGAAGIAYIGWREGHPTPIAPPRPPAPVPAHHSVGWIPLSVGVLIILCVVGAVVSYLRRPVSIVVDEETPRRWHVLLEAHARGHVVELRRGHVELPTDDHLEAGRIIRDLWVAKYGEPVDGVRLVASATPAS